MKDQLISFDVAKLAKEKGFNWNVTTLIMNDNYNYAFDYEKGIIAEFIKQPTQSLLQKWIREEHGIDILVKRSFSDAKKKYILTPCFDKPRLEGYDNAEGNTYEEALEIALIIALNMIK